MAELQPQVTEFVDAYVAGDDDTARELYAQVRVPYERIEPVAETLGVLDPRIDYREIDYLAEADLLQFDRLRIDTQTSAIVPPQHSL